MHNPRIRKAKDRTWPTYIEDRKSEDNRGSNNNCQGVYVQGEASA